ncbi:putative quinol monooxygenase [Brevundimonas sp.]|uniref:putative quinol monooxygenase n=1 Tax=Brevundimonas sp. TaxID=1871086 RepID=UPI0025BCAF3C|nr:putative quinol monooxygenase [Brevundimonas sp.]
MRPSRRKVVTAAAGLAVLGLPPVAGAGTNGRAMYGLIGRMTATPGQRDALTAILLESLGTMPGCLSYIVAHDPADDHAIWVTEVWTDQAAHRASLQVPEVKAAIARGLPLIATFEDARVTTPVGGVGFR